MFAAFATFDIVVSTGTAAVVSAEEVESAGAAVESAGAGSSGFFMVKSSR